MAKNVCVTGASGFIGTQLVKRLVSRGDQVKCFVRPTSCLSRLADLNCRPNVGDIVKDPSTLVEAISNVDTVYHVAASTHAVRSRDLIQINTEGTNNVLKVCALQESPPTVVFVSSLAANGPSRSRPHQEVHRGIRFRTTVAVKLPVNSTRLNMQIEFQSRLCGHRLYSVAVIARDSPCSN